MSVAWYIVLQREILGFDPRVNGKILARTGNVLEALAKHAGVVPLMEFFSAAPDERVEFAEDHGLNVEDIPVELPTEKWFSPEEGLKTVRRSSKH